MTDLVTIALSSWIIQDGNYADFAVGQEEAFAVEFWPPKPLQPGGGGHCAMTCLAGSTYDVVADVCFMDDDWWALDIGPMKVFCEADVQDGVKTGQRVSGRVSLGIDPFMYRDTLHSTGGAPALIYDWRIEGIQRDDTPWFETGPRMMDRDQRREKWTTISRTDAWGDDDGRAAYRLICRRLTREPRSAR